MTVDEAVDSYTTILRERFPSAPPGRIVNAALFLSTWDGLGLDTATRINQEAQLADYLRC